MMDKLSQDELIRMMSDGSGSSKLSQNELINLVNQSPKAPSRSQSLASMGASYTPDMHSDDFMTAGLARAYSNFAHFLNEIDVLPDKADKTVQQYFKPYYENFEGKEQNLGSFIGEKAVEYLPAALVPEIGAEEIGGSLLTKTGSYFARKGLSGAMGAAITTPEGQDIGTSMAIGAVANPMISLPFTAAKSVGKSLYGTFSKSGLAQKLANMAKKSGKPLSEIEQDLTLYPNEPTAYGDILNNKELSKEESNILPSIPFVGKPASEKLHAIATNIADKTRKTYKKLVPNQLSWDQISSGLANTIDTAVKGIKATKNALYNASNNAAAKKGIQIPLESIHTSAWEEVKNLKDIIQKLGLDPSQGANQKALNILSGTKNNSTILDAKGNPFKTIPTLSLKDASLAKGVLNDLLYSAKYSEQPGAERVFTILKDALKNDIDGVLNKAGNEDIKNLYQQAENFYKESYAPTLSPDIKNIILGKADSDNILNTFVPEKGAHKLNVLGKILEAAPDTKNLLLNGVFSKVLNKSISGREFISPTQLKTLFDNLGYERVKMLSGKDAADDARKLVRYMQNNPRAMSYIHNPLTGQMNSDLIGMLSVGKATGDIASDLLSNNFLSAAQKMYYPLKYFTTAKNLSDPSLTTMVIDILKGKPQAGLINQNGQTSNAISQIISAILAQNL